MREIEIKARIKDKNTLFDVFQKQSVTLSDPIKQRDQVFGMPGVDGGDDANHAAWLRIRTEEKDGKTTHIFTLKKSVTNQLDSIEHETDIADSTELAKIIGHLGFTPYSDLTKTRQKGRQGDIEICIDTIDELGDFIEAEKLTDESADYEVVTAELWQLLEGFGVDRSDRVTDGYDVLMRKHMGLEG